MKLPSTYCESLRREGCCTLQIPMCYIDVGSGMTTQMLDLPDNWFHYRKLGGGSYHIKISDKVGDLLLRDLYKDKKGQWFSFQRLAFGKEQGFLFFSREGYLANKDAICKAYANASKDPDKMKLENEFHAFAMADLLVLDKATKAYIKATKEKHKSFLKEARVIKV